ncbi:serum amyloid A-4 protein isoform X1 [Oryctolagus cuniculus]|uniref:serum amyloid A-4 protein isoform X1 n=1 Tax=Oryctolagus cuniculus TaxID=9986 RepID=UPI00048C3D8B|nr:serum amyloid A-4 protein isoform X1 [Oryctolagus cuniculus]
MRSSTMRLVTGIVLCSLVVGVSGEGWFSFFKEAIQGAGDLFKSYWDMREANYQRSDRYFYARGNYEAAQRGPGGVWAAKVISNARGYLEDLFNRYYFGSSNHRLEDSQSNRKAEDWGRSGKNPDHFRPSDLPEKY